MTIGIIILTIGILAPVASGTLSASAVLYSFFALETLLAIVIGVIVFLGGRGVSLMFQTKPSVVVVGTMLWIALFRCVPVGPLIARVVCAVSACGQNLR